MQVNSAGGQVAIGTMTYGSSGAFALFNFAQSPTSVAPLQVSNLTFTGAPIILVSGNVPAARRRLPADPVFRHPQRRASHPPGRHDWRSDWHDFKQRGQQIHRLGVAPGNGNQLTWVLGSGIWNATASAPWFNGTGFAAFVDGDFVISSGHPARPH